MLFLCQVPSALWGTWDAVLKAQQVMVGLVQGNLSTHKAPGLGLWAAVSVTSCFHMVGWALLGRQAVFPCGLSI